MGSSKAGAGRLAGMVISEERSLVAREKAAALARDDDASRRRQIVDQIGIVDQGVKQVKAGERRWDSIADALADLGKPEEIGTVFAGFQKYLYQQSA